MNLIVNTSNGKDITTTERKETYIFSFKERLKILFGANVTLKTIVMKDPNYKEPICWSVLKTHNI